MPARLATCVCGQLTASCAGDPTQVSLCHCIACQRRTGSTYGVAAFFLRENVIVAGDAKAYTGSSDSGYPVTFYFCPDCGSTVYWRPARKPKMVAVAVGAFARSGVPGTHSSGTRRTSASMGSGRARKLGVSSGWD